MWQVVKWPWHVFVNQAIFNLLKLVVQLFNLCFNSLFKNTVLSHVLFCGRLLPPQALAFTVKYYDQDSDQDFSIKAKEQFCCSCCPVPTRTCKDREKFSVRYFCKT